jgi:hypothetical protein
MLAAFLLDFLEYNMKVDDIETLILTLDGEVPNTNKEGKELVATELAKAFLASKEVDTTNMSLDGMAAAIEAILNPQPTGDLGNNITAVNSGKPAETKMVDAITVTLPCSVEVIIDGKEHKLKSGQHDLPKQTIKELMDAGIQVGKK